MRGWGGGGGRGRRGGCRQDQGWWVEASGVQRGRERGICKGVGMVRPCSSGKEGVVGCSIGYRWGGAMG